MRLLEPEDGCGVFAGRPGVHVDCMPGVCFWESDELLDGWRVR